MGVVKNHKEKEYKRFGIYLVCLDPTIGSEIKKTRPCIIISPKEMNNNLNTVIIAPMTSKIRRYPCRLQISFQGENGEIAFDQIKTIDKKSIGVGFDNHLLESSSENDLRVRRSAGRHCLLHGRS